MIGITTETIDDFIEYLFKTVPFQMQIPENNKEGFKNIFKNLLYDIYKNNPKDILNYMESNASNLFLDLLYREAGISDYHIKRIPENLKVRISYLLNVLNLNRSTQAVFKLFHEALEEFYPKMNIYLIDIQTKLDINGKTELVYKLDPRYITDPDNEIEEVTANELSGAFLMRPEQFIDREEKFSNIYPDYKSKQRVINIFPVKTGILYIQNPTGLGQSKSDNYIPLMQMIGASLEQYNLFPWKLNEYDKKKNVPFSDFIKLCTYLKYKEFEFKSIKLHSKIWRWETFPHETFKDKNKLISWQNALIQSENNGYHWSLYYNYTQTKLNDMLLNKEDLEEAERLELVYKGLKRSGKFNGRNNLNQFKTDWNTLRQKPRNTSLRKVSNIDEFREEMVGQEPFNLLEFEILLLMKFQKVIHGDTRDSIVEIKKLYKTNTENTLDPVNGLATLINKFKMNTEYNDFVKINYNNYENIEKNETKFLLDLLNYYINLGTTPLLKNYNYIKKLKFPELIDLQYTDPKYSNSVIYKKVFNELTNDTNNILFKELNSIVKVRYRSIIESIDELTNKEDTGIETYTMCFLYLWKLIQSDLKNDSRIRVFWNELFMRLIMGSTFKDFFFDPIMDLFLEYWFPAETTTQNKDIQTIMIKDKMQSIPLESICYNYYNKEVTNTLTFKDQNKITIYNNDNTIKEIVDNIFKEPIKKDLQIIISN